MANWKVIYHDEKMPSGAVGVIAEYDNLDEALARVAVETANIEPHRKLYESYGVRDNRPYVRDQNGYIRNCLTLIRHSPQHGDDRLREGMEAGVATEAGWQCQWCVDKGIKKPW